MNAKLSITVLAALLFCSCSKEDAHVHGPGGTHPEDPAHAHTERIDLGQVMVGGVAVQVFQLSKTEPGKEGDFDLDFAAGQPLPTVRGWIGVESAKGSMKVRFEKETASRMHGHPEVPKPVPEGSKLWLEIETAAGAQKGAIAFRP